MKKLILLAFIIALASCNSKHDKAVDYFDQGAKCERMKDYHGALEYYSQSIAENPDVAGVYLSRARVRSLLGDMAGTAADCDMAVQLDHTMGPKAYAVKTGGKNPYREGTDYKQDDEPVQTEEQKKAAMAEENAAQYRQSAVMKYQAGDPNGALASLDAAIKIRPDDAEAYLFEGKIYASNKKVKEAVECLSHAIALKPDYTDAYFARGMVEEGQKQYKSAMKDYNIVLAQQPNSAGAYSERGVLNYDLKNRDSACADFKKAAALGDTDAARFVRKFCK